MLQLQHEQTGLWLRADPGRVSRSERDCMAVELTSSPGTLATPLLWCDSSRALCDGCPSLAAHACGYGADSGTHFVLQPALKMQTEGERVRHGDQVLLYAASSTHYVHLASAAMASGPHQGAHEVDLSTTASRWRLRALRPYPGRHLHGALRSGDVVVVRHRQEGGLLGARLVRDTDHADAGRWQGPTLLHDGGASSAGSDARNATVLALWRLVILDDPMAATIDSTVPTGVLTSGARALLVHLISGMVLTLGGSSTSGGGLDHFKALPGADAVGLWPSALAGPLDAIAHAGKEGTWALQLVDTDHADGALAPGATIRIAHRAAGVWLHADTERDEAARQAAARAELDGGRSPRDSAGAAPAGDSTGGGPKLGDSAVGAHPLGVDAGGISFSSTPHDPDAYEVSRVDTGAINEAILASRCVRDLFLFAAEMSSTSMHAPPAAVDDALATLIRFLSTSREMDPLLRNGVPIVHRQAAVRDMGGVEATVGILEGAFASHRGGLALHSLNRPECARSFRTLRLCYRLLRAIIRGNDVGRAALAPSLQLIMSQLGYKLKAADTLMSLVRDNRTLLESLPAEVVPFFVGLIRTRGRVARYLGFLSAVLTCNGRGVMANQRHVFQDLVVENPGLLFELRFDPGAGGLMQTAKPGQPVAWVPIEQFTTSQGACSLLPFACARPHGLKRDVPTHPESFCVCTAVDAEDKEFFTQQMRLLALLCASPNEMAVATIRRWVSGPHAMWGVKTSTLPAQLREAYALILEHAFVDCDPQMERPAVVHTRIWDASLGADGAHEGEDDDGVDGGAATGATTVLRELQGFIAAYFGRHPYLVYAERKRNKFATALIRLAHRMCEFGLFRDRALLMQLSQALVPVLDGHNDVVQPGSADLADGDLYRPGTALSGGKSSHDLMGGGAPSAGSPSDARRLQRALASGRVGAIMRSMRDGQGSQVSLGVGLAEEQRGGVCLDDVAGNRVEEQAVNAARFALTEDSLVVFACKLQAVQVLHYAASARVDRCITAGLCTVFAEVQRGAQVDEIGRHLSGPEVRRCPVLGPPPLALQERPVLGGWKNEAGLPPPRVLSLVHTHRSWHCWSPWTCLPVHVAISSTCSWTRSCISRPLWSTARSSSLFVSSTSSGRPWTPLALCSFSRRRASWPADLAGTIVSSYATWAVEASVYWIVAFAFTLDLSYTVMLIVVGVVNLAGLLPAAPGNLGVFEFFASEVLTTVGVPEATAVAYAIAVHVVIWLPPTVAGLFFLTRQGLNLSALTRAEELQQSVAG